MPEISDVADSAIYSSSGSQANDYLVGRQRSPVSNALQQTDTDTLPYIPEESMLLDPCSSVLKDNQDQKRNKLPSGRYDYGLTQSDLDRIESWTPSCSRLPKQVRLLRRSNLSVSQWQEYRRGQWAMEQRVAEFPIGPPNDLEGMTKLGAIWLKWVDEETDPDKKAQLKEKIMGTTNNIAPSLSKWNETIREAVELQQRDGICVGLGETSTRRSVRSPKCQPLESPFMQENNDVPQVTLQGPTKTRRGKTKGAKSPITKARSWFQGQSFGTPVGLHGQGAMDLTSDLDANQDILPQQDTMPSIEQISLRSEVAIKQENADARTTLMCIPQLPSSSPSPFTSTSNRYLDIVESSLPKLLSHRSSPPIQQSTLTGPTFSQVSCQGQDTTNKPRVATGFSQKASKHSGARPMHLKSKFLPALNTILQLHNEKLATIKDIRTWKQVNRQYRTHKFWKKENERLRKIYHSDDDNDVEIQDEQEIQSGNALKRKAQTLDNVNGIDSEEVLNDEPVGATTVTAMTQEDNRSASTESDIIPLGRPSKRVRVVISHSPDIVPTGTTGNTTIALPTLLQEIDPTKPAALVLSNSKPEPKTTHSLSKTVVLQVPRDFLARMVPDPQSQNGIPSSSSPKTLKPPVQPSSSNNNHRNSNPNLKSKLKGKGKGKAKRNRRSKYSYDDEDGDSEWLPSGED
ncbi:hypothetical protein UCRPC4_g03502 [Phaeomoniella chlamydospora]|uniref:Uncharacterized protein n=1 Tax=Phaeomoniella chlamydospora TaxID=158046 RepID=A0A0G2GYM2_PHACM|nr:hypothetical protein UCRPC4_g03502 [Phaeomoniella chlamydospora]